MRAKGRREKRYDEDIQDTTKKKRTRPIRGKEERGDGGRSKSAAREEPQVAEILDKEKGLD